MTNVWQDARHIFSKDDGSLPEVTFAIDSIELVALAYEQLQAAATHIASQSPSYWSRSKATAVAIQFGSNPALELISGDADPFHVVFGGIRSRSNYLVPSLGVFCLHKEIAIDYRMGSDWNNQSVLGFFEVLDDLSRTLSTDVFEHRENLNDGGTDLLRIWQYWREGTVA